MPRPPRLQVAGGVYHITSRSVEGRAILPDDWERKALLGILACAVLRHEWVCYAYCLMGNHYHLVAETPNANLAEGMHRINGGFAQLFNRRHGRTGHVFERRYYAGLISDERHLLGACRYVVLNPVRAGLCDLPEDWRWSSFRATAGITPSPPFLSAGTLLAELDRDHDRAQAYYRDLVAGPGPLTMPH